MKKMLIAVSLILFTVPVWAANINISGRAGVYTPTQAGASPTMMYGVAADYAINQNLSVRGALETTTYTVNNVQYAFTPVTLDLIYSQNLGGNLHPYAGAGVSYNSTTSGGSATQTAGAQTEIGISYNLGGFSAGFELRYLIPDLNHTNTGSTSYNGYATGSFSQSLSF